MAVAWYDGATRTVELTSQTAVWYRSGKPPVLIRWVLIRDPQGFFATQALLCTNPSADPMSQILEWFVLRWQLEVTFQEVRTHLGVETQRQWSDLAIARTTPVLLGLFSLDRPGRSRVAKTAPHDPAPSGLVVRNLCNDGLIGTGPFPGHTGFMETIAEQSGIPPVISRMLVY